MTTNEILLIISAVSLIALLQFALKKLPNKTQFFIRLSAAILLLFLVWGLGSGVNNGGAKIILTFIALSSIAKDVNEQFLNKKKAKT